MRAARPFVFLILAVLAGCMLPRPPEHSGDHVKLCPPQSSAPHSGWLIISYRLPDCRSGFRWTDFRSDGPIFAVQNGTQTSIVTDKEWHRLLRAAVAGYQGRPPIVYVHGYRTDHDAALRRSRAIAELPADKRPVITVTWPSYADLTKYFWDQTNNQFARSDAARQLREIGSAHAGTVLIAHSMGNHILLEAVTEPPGARFGRLIMASPDVDRAELVRRLAQPNGLGSPATLYASRADQALSTAWRSHGLPRGGDLSRWVTGREMLYVYLDAQNTEVIDTSEAPAGPTGHAAFIENEAAAADLCRVLDGVATEAGRRKLGGHHWLLHRRPPEDDCLTRAREAVKIALEMKP